MRKHYDHHKEQLHNSKLSTLSSLILFVRCLSLENTYDFEIRSRIWQKLLDIEVSQTCLIAFHGCSILKRVQLRNICFDNLFTHPSKLALIGFHALTRAVEDQLTFVYKSKALLSLTELQQNRAKNYVDHRKISYRAFVLFKTHQRERMRMPDSSQDGNKFQCGPT